MYPFTITAFGVEIPAFAGMGRWEWRKLRGGRTSAGGGGGNPLTAAKPGGGAGKSAPCRKIGRKNHSEGVFLQIICTFFASGRKKTVLRAIPCYNSESVRGGAILTLTGVFR
ncbi:MAG: hypothetical protein ACR2QC_02285 [Gammaproteobacteria bacterium]